MAGNKDKSMGMAPGYGGDHSPRPIKTGDCRMSEVQRIASQAIANMSHADMGLVIDVIEYHLPEILMLDVQVMTHNERGVKDTVLWVEGPEYVKAVPILEQMADVVRQRDPYKTITVDGARAMFGLPPIQTASPSWSKNMAATIRHFLLRRGIVE